MKIYHGVEFYEKEYDFIIGMESLLKEPIPIMSDLSQEDFGMYTEDGHILILKLNNKQLSCLPDSIGNLTDLEELYLCGNNLKSLPESLGRLQFLNILDIYNNQLELLPNSFVSLNALEILKLEGNNIESLPVNFGSLSDLEEIYLSRNKLTHLPENMGNLERLYILNLDRNKLAFLPESFTDLEELEQLYLNENALEFLPKLFGNIESLEMLQLSRNKLRKLPRSIKKLRRLETLHLSGNRLNKIPKVIGNINRLEVIKIDGNQITKLPKSIRYLKRLENLFLSNNRLKNLPSSIGEAESLEMIKLEGNEITKLPVSLGSLESLTMIYLPESLKKRNVKNINKEFLTDYDSTQLDPLEKTTLYDFKELIGEEIPRTVDFESNFFSVYIENGHITNLVIPFKNLKILPKSILNLTKLKKLNLRGNKLTDLPESIKNLESLMHLDLSHNMFNELPGNLWSLKSITKLELKYNLWNIESKAIIRNSIPVILDHCRKKATITLFISHAVIENKKYKIADLVSYLENQPEIYKVYHCESDLIGNIDVFMEKYIPMSQILLFVATKKSVCFSKDCRRELEIALQNDIPIIPIMGDDASWDDLKDLNISREFGIDFGTEEFEIFCRQLYAKIVHYKQNINVFEKEETKIDKQILNFKNVFFNLIESNIFKQIVRKNLIDMNYEQFIKKSLLEQARFLVQYLTKLIDSNLAKD